MNLFDGPPDINDTNREPRLKTQLIQVFEYMRSLNGAAVSLSQIANDLQLPSGSVSARFRDLRKPHFGGFTLNKEHIKNGLYNYSLDIESGDAEYVYNPIKPSRHKAEAANRVREFLRHQQRDTKYLFYGGAHLDINDLRALIS